MTCPAQKGWLAAIRRQKGDLIGNIRDFLATYGIINALN